MNRIDLHKLIDGLPDSKLPVAQAYLEGLRDGIQVQSPLDAAPYDDEPYTDEERKAELKANDSSGITDPQVSPCRRLEGL